MNDLYLNILLDMVAWTLITVGLLGFVAVVWSEGRDYLRKRRQRRAWQRMPELQPGRRNVRLHRVM